MTIKKNKMKSAEQRFLEKDLRSTKYKVRREEGVEHYDRNKQKRDWIKEEDGEY